MADMDDIDRKWVIPMIMIILIQFDMCNGWEGLSPGFGLEPVISVEMVFQTEKQKCFGFELASCTFRLFPQARVQIQTDHQNQSKQCTPSFKWSGNFSSPQAWQKKVL